MIKQGKIESHNNLRIPNELVLRAGPRAVKKVKALMIDDHHDGSFKKTRLTLSIEKRQNQQSQWYVEREFALEGAEITALQGYIETINKLIGVPSGQQYLVIPEDEVAGVNSGASALEAVRVMVQAMINGKLGDLLQSANIDGHLIRALSSAIRYAQYQQAYAIFEDLVQSNAEEEQLRQWLQRNHWIFGTEYVSVSSARKLAFRSQIDILLQSVDGFFDVIELKRAGAKVLTFDSSRQHWHPSSELSNVIGQVVTYLQEVEDFRLNITESEGINILKPRGRIVIGRSLSWDKAQRRTLRMLNAQFANIEIMTYDELLARGRTLLKVYSVSD